MGLNLWPVSTDGLIQSCFLLLGVCEGEGKPPVVTSVAEEKKRKRKRGGVQEIYCIIWTVYSVFPLKRDKKHTTQIALCTLCSPVCSETHGLQAAEQGSLPDQQKIMHRDPKIDYRYRKPPATTTTLARHGACVPAAGASAEEALLKKKTKTQKASTEWG